MDDSGYSLLPTPRAQNGEPRNQTIWARPLSEPQNLENALAERVASGGWGKYAPAVERWESVMGAAPEPAQITSAKPQLEPRFVEWMMGLPSGWVTGCRVSRNEALMGLGNGVVPQQAFAALSAAAGRF